jgi:hypothetical protein
MDGSLFLLQATLQRGSPSGQDRQVPWTGTATSDFRTGRIHPSTTRRYNTEFRKARPSLARPDSRLASSLQLNDKFNDNLFILLSNRRAAILPHSSPLHNLSWAKPAPAAQGVIAD